MAYYWYGLGTNSRYIETISDIDVSILDENVFRKYQETITNQKGGLATKNFPLFSKIIVTLHFKSF